MKSVFDSTLVPPQQAGADTQTPEAIRLAAACASKGGKATRQHVTPWLNSDNSNVCIFAPAALGRHAQGWGCAHGPYGSWHGRRPRRSRGLGGRHLLPRGRGGRVGVEGRAAADERRAVRVAGVGEEVLPTVDGHAFTCRDRLRTLFIKFMIDRPNASFSATAIDMNICRRRRHRHDDDVIVIVMIVYKD